jgi:hypothetical protein
VDILHKAEVGELLKAFDLGQQAVFGQFQQQIFAQGFCRESLGGQACVEIHHPHFHAGLQAHAGKLSGCQDHLCAICT